MAQCAQLLPQVDLPAFLSLTMLRIAKNTITARIKITIIVPKTEFILTPFPDRIPRRKGIALFEYDIPHIRSE